MPDFDRTPYPDGFALIVSSPAVRITVPEEPWPIRGTPRARRFQIAARMRCRFADDQEWRPAITRDMSHSGLLFHVAQTQPEWTSVTSPTPGSPVVMVLDVPTDADAPMIPVRAEGRLIRVNDSNVAVAVRGYWPE